MRRWTHWTLLVALSACVAKPEAARDGGTTCRRDDDCNRGVTCGEVALCVQGYCAADTVFRACADGGYGDAAVPVECITYVSCNAAQCGALIACVDGRCDPGAPRVVVDCDGG